MRRPRFLTPRVERVLERLGFAIYLLAALVLVGRGYVAGVSGRAVALPSDTIRASASPTAVPTTAPVATPAPTRTATVSITTTPSPQPSRDPLVVSAYVNGGRHFAALTAPNGYVLTSPIDGTVSVVVYQLLGGDIRVGSNVPSEPFFPYITITSSEMKVILRPGALRNDVELLVKDGDNVRAGSALFRIVGQGASSWHTFYDRGVAAQVLASATLRPSGAEIDPVSLFSR